MDTRGDASTSLVAILKAISPPPPKKKRREKGKKRKVQQEQTIQVKYEKHHESFRGH